MIDDPVSAAQRAALELLAPLIADAFYLGGGVAIAARAAHRRSADLDLFSATDPSLRQSSLESLGGVTIIGRAAGTLELIVGGVPTSLLQYRYPLLEATEAVPGISLPAASIVDLACMKLSAIASRGLARDFWDLDELIRISGHSMPDLLRAYQTKYPVEDIGYVIRALAYFGDAETVPLPPELAADEWQRIVQRFESRVAALVA